MYICLHLSLSFISGFCKLAEHEHNKSNFLYSSVWYLFNIYQIFIGHTISATIRRWEQDRSSAMVDCNKRRLLICPELSTQHHSKGHLNWEASIGHPIYRLNLDTQWRLASIMSTAWQSLSRTYTLSFFFVKVWSFLTVPHAKETQDKYHTIILHCRTHTWSAWMQDEPACWLSVEKSWATKFQTL